MTEPYYQADRVTLYLGDCIEVMRSLPEASVDAIVTDPPYGLEFMGKDWDAPWKSGDGFRRSRNPADIERDDPFGRASRTGPEYRAGEGFERWCEAWAREAYRVLKPGGHIVAFGGTRTHHRLVCGIEDAGFEIRDELDWMFGSGFPKSLDVSKAIDRAAGAERTEVVGTRGLAEWKPGAPAGVAIRDDGGMRQDFERVNTLLAPATDAAREWQGWGTALKPAHESVTWATKPVDGATIDASLSRLEADLWSMLSASGVALPSPSNPSVSDVGLFDGARWSADGSLSTPGDSSAQTATSPSAEAMTTCWNTVRSWRRISGVFSEAMSTYTTAITSSLTTDLQTLYSSLAQLTATNMHQNVMTERGSTPPVSTVVECFAGVAAKLQAIRVLSAPVSAIGQARTSLLVEGDLSPAHEPVCLARKPLIGTVAANVLAHGTGAINVDGCRIGMDETLAREKGGWLKGGYVGGESPQWDSRGVTVEGGRWPANVILDEEAAALLDDTVGELQIAGNKPSSMRSVGSGIADQSTQVPTYSGGPISVFGDRGGPSRFFKVAKWTSEDVSDAELSSHLQSEQGDSAPNTVRFHYDAKASRSEREAGLDDLPPTLRTDGRDPGGVGGDNPRLRVSERRNDHPTVKPVSVMRWLVRLITPPGGVVLDPFLGSGTTGMAALDEQMRFVGIDMTERYVEIARYRVTHRHVIDHEVRPASEALPQGRLL